ncbi:hypothetical protein AB6C48_23265, partial [Vibrio splendidus]
VNDHQGDGVTRVWFALVLLCRVAASFNKAFNSDQKRLAFSLRESICQGLVRVILALFLRYKNVRTICR